MSDGQEEDEVISGYDPAIMRRLLGYARPYRLLLAGAIVALIIATAADLLLPVIVQRAVDRQLLASYTRIPVQSMELPELRTIDRTRVVTLAEASYVPDDLLVVTRGVARARLVEAGIADQTRYHVFPLADRPSPVLDAALTDRGEAFGRPYAALPADRLSDLPPEDLRDVRAADLRGLRSTSSLFFATLLAALVFTFAQIYLTAVAGQEVMKDMRSGLLDHLVRQRLAYLAGSPVGRLVTRVTNDVETINQLFTDVLVSLLRNVALMAGSVVTLLLLNWRLGVVTLLTLPPVLLLTVHFRTRARDAFRKVRVRVSRLNSFLSEHLSGMAVVQLFVRERRTGERFRERNEKLLEAELGETYVFAVFRPLIDLLSSVSVAVIIYFGARFFMSGLVSLGVLIAFVNLIRRFYQPVMGISEQFTVLQSAMAGAERVFEMMDHTDRIPDTGAVVPAGRGAIVFDHVWFAYRDGEPVIKDLSFSVEPGQTVAVVGYTGSGKTTVANLVTRLWDVDAGSIRIDGVDIREYGLDALRSLAQPVQQDVFLFGDTIRNNIALGLDLRQERLEEMARMVQADRFIDRLPLRYETRLTEGATNISAGERQLLSFARILAHDPRIMIMDEATASIDTETERLIQKAIEVLMRGRTSLVIAHRLSTIRHADRILVLSEGRLAESGSHDELVLRGGLYYNLYRLQYQEGPA